MMNTGLVCCSYKAFREALFRYGGKISNGDLVRHVRHIGNTRVRLYCRQTRRVAARIVLQCCGDPNKPLDEVDRILKIIPKNAGQTLGVMPPGRLTPLNYACLNYMGNSD